MTDTVPCPVCESGESRHYATIDQYAYYSCLHCDSIHIAPQVIDDMDAGIALVGEYAEGYWEQERVGALERAAGVSLCLAGESILYCRRPVGRFLDLGAGPGFLLGNLHELLDPPKEIFHGVEKFPPPYAVRGDNFHECGVESLRGRFDAGVCIEVIEHLTPRMLEGMLSGLAAASEPGSFWLFNTGMPDYVRNEDPGYLDPVERGHIVSYSIRGLGRIFQRHGFRVEALPGRSFAFFAEYEPAEPLSFEERIHRPLAGNVALLQRHPLLYQAAYESARSYFFYSEYLQRTRWALSLDAMLKRGDGDAATGPLPSNLDDTERQQ